MAYLLRLLKAGFPYDVVLSISFREAEQIVDLDNELSGLKNEPAKPGESSGEVTRSGEGLIERTRTLVVRKG